MKFILCSLLAACALSVINCASRQVASGRLAEMGDSPTATATPSPTPGISLEEATAIAKSDFKRLRGSLDDFVIDTSEQKEGWRIVIRLKKEHLVGIGVVYIIDRQTGKISSREYYQ